MFSQPALWTPGISIPSQGRRLIWNYETNHIFFSLFHMYMHRSNRTERILIPLKRKRKIGREAQKGLSSQGSGYFHKLMKFQAMRCIYFL
jgi:hypothetical protein